SRRETMAPCMPRKSEPERPERCLLLKQALPWTRMIFRNLRPKRASDRDGTTRPYRTSLSFSEPWRDYFIQDGIRKYGEIRTHPLDSKYRRPSVPQTPILP